MKAAIRQFLTRLICKFTDLLTDEGFTQFIFFLIARRSQETTPGQSLKLLFKLDALLYHLQGQMAVAYGGGLHTKHRHIKYHDFFIKNTPKGSHVLDVGCGNGALTSDIAGHVGEVVVYGIDLVQENIDLAKEKYPGDNITYVCGDALTDLPDKPFDVVILSNVLEHIERRVEFLSMLNQKYHPSHFLVRVPCFDRDWRVPLKKELGLDYRLDETHAIEYLYDQFAGELQEANLHIGSAKVNWGEIWAVVKPGVV
jgi:SAM-dependent methyltransferase